MLSLRYWLWLKLLLISLSLLNISSCSSPKQQQPAGSNKSDKGDDDDDDDDCRPSSSQKDDDDDDDDDDDFDLAGGKGYRLAAATYEADIASMFKSKCVSCHAKGNDANDDNKEFDCSDPDSSLSPGVIDLSTFSLVKDNADEIIKRLKATDDCKMPPSGSIDEDVFEDWMDGGFLRGDDDDDDDDSSSDDSGCGSSYTSGDDDDDDLPKEEPDPAFFTEFLNPTKLKECHQQGKMYSRRDAACDEIFLLAATCDEAWVTEHFGMDAATVKQQVESQQSVSGIKLDQCGASDTELKVSYYCAALESGGECVDPNKVQESAKDTVVVRDFNAKKSK